MQRIMDICVSHAFPGVMAAEESVVSFIVKSGLLHGYPGVIVTDDVIFLFFRKFNVFSIVNSKFYLNSWTLQRMSRMTKHVSKAGKVDPGDRVTLPVKFACKPELTLTRLLG